MGKVLTVIATAAVSAVVAAAYVAAYALAIAGTTYVVKCTWQGVWLW